MPRYSTTNVLTSLTLHLATFLRGRGYDVFWQTTGETDTHTSSASSPRATITIVPDFPANPAMIVGLKDESAGPEQIAVPVLTLQLPRGPIRHNARGLGHRDFEWLREVKVYALAADEFQHRELADDLHDWLADEYYKPLPILDYDTDPVTPPELAPVYVDVSAVERAEMVTEIDALRYPIEASAMVVYVE